MENICNKATYTGNNFPNGPWKILKWKIFYLMMNAELVAANQSKIIIPTVFRKDYLSALRKLSRQNQPDPYIRMLLKAWKFSSNLIGVTMVEIEKKLTLANALKEPEEGRLIIE